MSILFLLIISILARLMFLFFGMPSITHDEADFFLNSYYLAKTGSDVFKRFLFLSTGHLTANASLPVYLGSIPFLFFEKNIILGRLPYTIISIFTPIFLYLFLKNFFDKKIAFLTTITFLLSPWFSYMSTQAAIEQITYLFFFSTSLYLSLYINKNLKLKIFFYLSLFMMFNSYMGGKITFPFFVFNFYLINNLYNKEKINFKKIIKFFIFSLILTLIFIKILFIFSNKYLTQRTNDVLIITNKNLVENLVWYERLTTIAPNIIKKIISNKFTIIYNLFIEKYIEAFNLKYLFVKGDPHSIYGNNIFGLFYFWQIIFFIYGLSYLIYKLNKEKKYIPILLFILFSPITIGLNAIDLTITLRGFPLSFFYSFLVSLGIWLFINNNFFIYKKLFFKKFFLIIIILNIFSFFYFFFIYSVRIRTLSSEQWHLSEKKLFEKIKSQYHNSNKKIFILNNEPEGTFLLYSFFYINNPSLIKNNFNSKNFYFNNLYFKKDNYNDYLNNNNLILLIKRNHFEVEKRCSLIKKCSIFLEANDKSGPIYYKIET